MNYTKRFKQLTIDFRITEKCNYSCPYCSPNNWRTESDLMYSDKLLINLLNIINVLNSDRKLFRFDSLKLMISGGEPSLIGIKKYEDLFESINGRSVGEVVFSTNFSADETYYIRLIEIFQEKGIKFKIDAAYHRSGADFEEFFQKAMRIYEKYPKSMKMHFTFDDDSFIGLENVYKVIDSGIEYNIKRVISKVNQKTDSYNDVDVKNKDLEHLFKNQSRIKKERHKAKGIIDEAETADDSYQGEDGQIVSRDQIRDLDLSDDNALCMNHTITIMRGDLMVNCEYIRKIHPERIHVYNLLGKTFTVQEVKPMLIDVLCVECDKDGKTCRGGNCHPMILSRNLNAMSGFACIEKMKENIDTERIYILQNL